MIRRVYGAAVSVLIAALLAGCGSTAEAGAPAPSDLPATAPAPEPEPEGTTEPATTDEAEVIDLTGLSATMMYAQLFDITSAPTDYIGRTIALTGEYIRYEGNPDNPGGAQYYYTVSVSDATACCQLGLEFLLPEGVAYPSEGQTITIRGVYTPYDENGGAFYRLADAAWEPA